MVSVALCNYEFPPGCGGGGVFTADLAAALRSQGHGVQIVADKRESATAATSRLLTYPLRSLPTIVGAAGDADVINGHFAIPTSTALPAVSALRDTPLVVNLMGADVYDPTRYERVRPALNALLEHWIGRTADALVVPSEDMASRVPDALQPKTHTIPYFVDGEQFTPGTVAPDPPTRVCTVARLVERKQLSLGLRAIAVLRDRGYDVKWTIAGAGPRRDALEMAAQHYGVADRVDFAGYVDDEALPAFYRDHDVFLLPSEHEAFGIAAVEAMASGLPVVATDTGGHAEVAGPPGAAVTPTAEALAAGIVTVTTDLRERSQAARMRVEKKYVASAVVPQYEQLYRAVSGYS